MNVYHRVTNLAKQKKISISSLEKSAELPNGTIYNWKNSKPNIEYVSRVAGVLNTTVDYLVGRTNTPNSDFESSPVDILDDETILAFDGMEIEESEKEKLRDYARYIISLREKENI
ncbi:transcriptional regulator [Leuconostoc mesenteroides]|uniref:transcriptional regulator n=1 Tax=Leuconostoc mesenteroides TaxID=1245 RepID=UPI0021A4D019|nr:transcriptional regulator [Leuconostoc mesenteroides]MCT3037722.1 transcriptional regulator [Leuconostoc mesenteroides]